MRLDRIPALPAAVLVAACASMGAASLPSGVKATDGMLTNDSGMTLYMFDKGAGDRAGDGFLNGAWHA